MELTDSEEIRKHLLDTNEQFRDMVQEHHDLDVQAQNQQDEVEEHRLKKLKLQLKDRIEGMVSQYKTRTA